MTVHAPATVRDLITAELAHGPCPTDRLALTLRLDRPAVVNEMRRMADAGLVRSTSRGWHLRTQHTNPPTGDHHP